MKKTLIVLILAFTSFVAAAQPQTPVRTGSSGDITIDRGQRGSDSGMINAYRTRASVPANKKTKGLTVIESGHFYTWNGSAWDDMTGTGGGGSSDSSWTYAEFGVQPNTPGIIVNQSFNGGSLPANWRAGTSLTTSYTGAHLRVVGAGSWSVPGTSTSTPYASGMQYDSLYMQYEKLTWQMDMKLNTISSAGKVVVSTGSNGFNFSNKPNIAFYTGGTNAGRIGIGFELNFGVDSTSKATLSQGDSVRFWFTKSGFSMTAGIINYTTRKSIVTYFNGLNWDGQGGRYNICFLADTFDVYNTKFICNEHLGGVMFFGHSALSAGSSIKAYRYCNRVMSGAEDNFSVIAAPSVSAKYQLNNGCLDEALNTLHPNVVIGDLNFNDENESFGATAGGTATVIDTMISKIKRSGAAVMWMGPFPHSATSNHDFNDSLKVRCALRNVPFVDLHQSPIMNSGGYLSGDMTLDGTHLNNYAQSIEAKFLLAVAGSILTPYIVSDTPSAIKMNYVPVLPTSGTAMILGVDAITHNVGAIPNTLPTEASWIPNTLNYGVQTQMGAKRSYSHPGAIHEMYDIATDSIYRSYSPFGLQINFNDFTSGASATGTNIFIANTGIGGTGYPGVVGSSVITGLRDVYIYTASNKSSPVTISGNDNTLMQANVGNSFSGSWNTIIGASIVSTLTTGSTNVGIGQNALRGVTTGSNIISISSDNKGGSSFASTVSNVIQIGDLGYGGGWAAGDIDINPGANLSPTLYIGGKTGFGSIASVKFQGASGTNAAPHPATIYCPPGTGTNNTNSTISFASAVATGSGTTQQSSYRTELTIGPSAITTGSGTQVLINGSTAATSSIVDIQSTTKGFLPPRMSTAQKNAIPSPVKGMIVDDTTQNELFRYNGSAWVMASARGGSYTPTATNGTNITANTPALTTYSRTANVVTVFGSINVTATAAVQSDISITLPVASDLTAITDLNGLINGTTALSGGYMIADASTDKAVLKFTPSATGAQQIYFSFQYPVQ